MIKSWIGRKTSRATSFPPVKPQKPFYLIGDIHGRADLLKNAFAALVPQHPIVLVGDYVDRGEDSAGVLRLLMGRPNIHCIKGNHEDMLLSFLTDPVAHGPLWLRNGGLQTLASFGVGGLTETSRGSALNDAARALREAMGTKMINWLRNLPLTYDNGNVTVVHAGADPNTDLGSQLPEHLLWGHPDFGRIPRRDGQWVGRGHTIVDEPAAIDGIISVDTGAYATGRLTVAGIGDGSAEFLTLQ